MGEPIPIASAAGPIRLGYEEHAVLPDDGRRYEIIDGALAVSPAPRPWHQTVSRRLQFAFYTGLELPGAGLVFNAPIDVILSPNDIVQPDLVVLTASQRELVTERAIEGAPELLIEISSPSTRRRDVLVKSEVYQRCGVRRYWIVDPDLDRIEAFVLQGAVYVPEFVAAAPDVVHALGLTIDLGPIFAR
ncbi:MAG: Uma2 family endonuclease [Myxococcota bacterium]